MHAEDWMPTLDRLAHRYGYEAAARTEAIVIALVGTGVDYKHISITDQDGVIEVSAVSFDQKVHGRQAQTQEQPTLSGDHPAVRHLRPPGSGNYTISAIGDDGSVEIGSVDGHGYICNKIPPHEHEERQGGGYCLMGDQSMEPE